MAEQTPAVEIRLFGPIHITVRGAPLPRLRSRTSYWLLALLALRLGREVSREWLATALWPESEPELALYNLRRCLGDLRRALGPDAALLQSPSRHTLLLTQDGVAVDTAVFSEAIAGGGANSLVSAVEAYRAPLLEGNTEEWAVQEREIGRASCRERVERAV